MLVVVGGLTLAGGLYKNWMALVVLGRMSLGRKFLLFTTRSAMVSPERLRDAPLRLFRSFHPNIFMFLREAGIYDPEGFLGLLRRTGAVVTGWVPTLVLARGVFPEAHDEPDLEDGTTILVHQDHLATIQRFFVENASRYCGPRVEDLCCTTGSAGSGPGPLMSVIVPVSDEEVRESRCRSLQDLAMQLCAHTAEAVFLSGTGLFCPFPYSALYHHRGVNMFSLSLRQERANVSRLFFERRGYVIGNDAWELDLDHLSELGDRRAPMDGFSLFATWSPDGYLWTGGTAEAEAARFWNTIRLGGAQLDRAVQVVESPKE
ncbi:uncharacterized protein B0I36DRAFT_79199 [Microdochium trichocladiopsis]|uniref:Uncharacterized protein n=1 Tax=Microdochium trichocladiopsis TaxID=1682393 RepID=A0A9P8YFM0_9PEZI|nr:uncharacterized protein B0I36DRAFT_79199 [Microdochium trichocladiopsis]KAH7038433.1 hypothetical protein B0I36DRAFT_79199 [Microdochium trichocladiopsis]